MSAAHRQNSAHALPLAPQNRFALGGMRGNGLLFLLHLRLTSLLTRALQDDLLDMQAKRIGTAEKCEEKICIGVNENNRKLTILIGKTRVWRGLLIVPKSPVVQ